MKDLNKLGLGALLMAKEVASMPLVNGGRAGVVTIGVGPVMPLPVGVHVVDGSTLKLGEIQAAADRRAMVQGGTTGIRTSELSEPVHVARMDVTGAGSVGIELD